MGGASATVSFVAITMMQDNFQHFVPAAGIMGLGFPILNKLPESVGEASTGGAPMTQQPSALTQLLTDNNMSDAFSLCTSQLGLNCDRASPPPARPAVLSFGVPRPHAQGCALNILG